MAKSQIKQLSLPESIQLREVILSNSTQVEGREYRLWNPGWNHKRALETITDRFTTDLPAKNVAKALGINVRVLTDTVSSGASQSKIDELYQRLAILELEVKKLSEYVMDWRIKTFEGPREGVQDEDFAREDAT